MNLKQKHKITTTQVALVAIFSAIYAVMRIIPTVPVVGIEGSSFSAADIIAPIYGIILGPYIGGACVIIGTFLGMTVKVPYFFGLDFLPALVNAVALGFLMRKKWLPVVALYAVLLATFILNPLTLNFVSIPGTALAFPFTWLHLVSFAFLLIFGAKVGKWVQTAKPQDTYKIKENQSTFKRLISQIPPKSVIGFAIMCFIGTMMQHVTGNILYENILVGVTHAFTPEFLMLKWNIVFFLYPWERITLVVFATLIGVPVFYALKRTRLLKETNAPAYQEAPKIKS